MTNEEIRAKIHESLGWTKRMQGAVHYAWSRGDYWHYLRDAPRYAESLDACAEFEATLTDVEWEDYSDYLTELSDVDSWAILCGKDRGAVISSKPLIRCLAYLNTKGIE